MARKRNVPKPLLGLEIAVRTKGPEMLHDLAETLFKKVQENASLTDHSLQDLAYLGYPYSSTKGRRIHTPSYQVHKQSGELYDALEIIVVNQFRIRVGVDLGKAPHALPVIFGTSKMVGRDFITAALDETRDVLKAQGRDGVKEVLKHALDLSK